MRERAKKWIGAAIVMGGAVVLGMIIAGGMNITPPAFSAPQRPVQVQPSTTPVVPSFADLADAVSPAVVSIVAVSFEEGRSGNRGNPFEFFFRPRGQRPQEEPQQREERKTSGGSGFLVSHDGYIVTNNHVIDTANELVAHIGQDQYPAEVVGTDPATDLALLKIEAKNLPYLALGDSEALRVGDWVMAIGSPQHLVNSVTVGVVSAKGRSLGIADRAFEDFIQTDAAINFGNSGGPLVNVQGEVVGINTAITFGAENIGFAVPVRILNDVLPQLRDEGKVRRGYLGVAVDALDPIKAEAFGLDQAEGALVADVVEGTPAQKAGLRHGDIIIRVDGVAVKEPQDLIGYVSSKPPKTKVRVNYLRDGKKEETIITLAERDGTLETEETAEEPEESNVSWLGLSYQNLDDRLRGSHGMGEEVHGIWIRSVSPRSPLVDQGLRPGDVISEVNGSGVSSVKEFESLVGETPSGSVLRFYVERFDPRSGRSNQFFAFVRVP